MKLSGRLESLEPVSRIIEIPDHVLNQKLVPVNDNFEQTSMSRESLEAASILSPYYRPLQLQNNFGRSIGSIVVCVIVVAAVAGLLVAIRTIHL
jgi:hypothetical protein